MYMVAMTRIMLLYTQECALPDHTLYANLQLNLKSVLTLYCVPKVLFLTSVVTLVSRGNGWS